MKILFNCSTNIVGGGLKNSALFIKNAVQDQSIDWYFALSEPVANLLKKWDIDTNNNNFFIFKNSPARNKSAKLELTDLAKKKKIDIVYTMAGPAYVNFHCKHIMGISNPYITHADYDAYSLKGNFLNIFKYFVYTSAQFLYTYKSDYYIFQTEYSKNNFSKRSFISKSKMFVVPNAYDDSIRSHFEKSQNLIEKESNEKNVIQIFCPGAPYVHKAFQFLPKSIYELCKKTNKKFEFIVTLPNDSDIWLQIDKELKELNISQYCKNIGPYIYSDLIKYLNTCDIIYVPSLLETFSASYLEAMCAKKKLVVANKSFASDICKDYAIYTDPKNYVNTAKVFTDLFDEIKLSESEIQLADEILDRYGNQQNRFKFLKELIINLATK